MNNQTKEKLDQIRGEIISSATRVEFVLGYRLRKYFFPKSNNKATILFWNVINSPFLTYDNKISIYESIPHFKKLKGYSAIKDALRFIQRLRNVMAHWNLDEKESTPDNIIMFTLTGKYRKITINASAMEQYRSKITFILKQFGYNS